jgi:hypothetical protein
MSPQAILVAATAAAEVRDAVRTLTRGLDGRRGAVLVALNFTDFELVLDHSQHDCGAFHAPPEETLPARTAMVFSTLVTASTTGPKGHVDWIGTHPDKGDFVVRNAWNRPPGGAATAATRAFHRLPWPGHCGGGTRGMAVDTDFLRTAAIGRSYRTGAELVFELHPQRPMVRSIGALMQVTALRRLAGIAVVAATLVTGAGVAAAQTSPTVQFQSTYRAYNLWDDWKWWQPDKCTETKVLAGSEPAAPGRYPVLLYTHGMLADWGGNAEGKGVAELAAAEGFVAAAPEYDSWLGLNEAAVERNAKCIFGDGASGNALDQVCARPKADCSKGVVVAGFSLGGAIASRAANFAPVRAAWLMGVSGPAITPALAAPAGTRALANERLRITVGRSDVEVRSPTTWQVTGLDVAALDAMTGMSCSATRCLREDGSGYYVVDHSEVADGVADHCYWQSVTLQAPANSCSWTPRFEPGFRPPATGPWSLAANLGWLRSRLG